ncbi:MAG: hypothetical protein HY245_14760 [Rhizobiales bacterium]|nr:hypothetical protein [Hyphomicrobiales bacterium]MBI3674651.1 hypothetical protein [Hyphomicrobiales bacterium]
MGIIGLPRSPADWPVIPGERLLVVIAAGNYNAADQWKMPVQVMSKLVVPALA